MKDSYVGDIGDFANNGLLRHIFGGPGAPTVEDPLRLGVVWYLNQGKAPMPGGQTIGYLMRTKENRDTFRSCDPKLYDNLEWLVTSGNRTVQSLCDSEILPDTIHYLDSLFEVNRDKWFKKALVKMGDKDDKTDVVFVNPDTGIATKIMENSGKSKDREHTYLSQLKSLFKAGKSLIIYQHRNHEPIKEQEKNILKRLKEEMRLADLPWLLRWGPVSVRYYAIVPQKCHKSFFDRRIEALKGSEWCKKGHFMEVPFTVER